MKLNTRTSQNTASDAADIVSQTVRTAAPAPLAYVQSIISAAISSFEAIVDRELIEREFLAIIHAAKTKEDFIESLILVTTAHIEEDPVYGRVAARMLLHLLSMKVTGVLPSSDQSYEVLYRQSFVLGIEQGIANGIFDPRLASFDLPLLASYLILEQDDLFEYMGLKQLYDRYFTKIEKKHIELPQSFWMRVAMGVSLLEKDKNKSAIQFYQMLSSLRYIPGTPTLLHSGLTCPQLSSCYLTTVNDDLKHIFKCYADNAQMSKWSGGVANDWSYIRACGAMVNSIKTESQGVIPFIKIVDNITSAINRSGKRRGATVVYLETWHLEVEDFIDLKKNTGDERRRTHDINTAHWIPDLFMKRVEADQEWTLFSPHEVPDLHDLYGKAFEKRYEEYEQEARAGKFEMHKVVSAKQLWRKMLSRLFETGHPWICFKDVCNIRSPQDHVGVVHSSNLCTEITLNTSFTETAVCNLGSVNLAAHVFDGKVNKKLLEETVTTAVRMLDNVIDINFYPTKEGEVSNLKHRPIGLGIMGFQDLLYKLNVGFGSDAALAIADELGEFVAYYAILSSSFLARERGAYETFKGSKWDRGIFPQDTIALVEYERGNAIPAAKKMTLDWTPVYDHVRTYGMRNSNTMAIAPTATISNIAGVFPSLEPIYKNIYVKANMSGEFTVINKYLVEDLKKLGLWDQRMRQEIKFYDGSIQSIARIPLHLKEKYKEAFELDPLMLITITAARGRWIDQSQSHNVFMKGTSGKLLNDIYMHAWKQGLKTTYYLRTLGASQIEKSTLDAQTFGFTQKRNVTQAEQGAVSVPKDTLEIAEGAACSITDPSCESCQ